MNIVALISGRGSNLKAILEGIKKGTIKAKVSLVVSNRKDAKGLEIARSFGIKTLFLNPKDFPDRLSYDKKLAQIISKENPDLIVLAGFMRILSPEFIETFEGKIINIHPSLIPAFQGLNAQKQAVEFGARFSGCTVHFVTKELDNGPIIIQAVVPVLPEDTEESLSERILRYEHRIYPQAIKWLSEGRVEVKGRQVIVKNASYGTVPVNPDLEDF